jgi:CO/xanthine dehydrogenase Mo-binding subunit
MRIATSVEPAGTNLASYELITGRRGASGSAEAAMVRMEPDGTVRAAIGDPGSGQGYETVIAQIVADELGLSPEGIHVERGFDSATTPWLYLSGNYSNKFSVTDVGAVVGAARKVRDKLLRIAAHRLEAAVEDLELVEGEARVRWVPGRALPLRELARTAYADVLGLPPGEELAARARVYGGALLGALAVLAAFVIRQKQRGERKRLEREARAHAEAIARYLPGASSRPVDASTGRGGKGALAALALVAAAVAAFVVSRRTGGDEPDIWGPPR